MKIKHLLIGMLAIAAAVSCKQEEPEVVDPVLDVNKTEVALAATAGEASFEVTANNTWTATADADWVSLDPATGVGSDKAVAVKVTAEDNTVTEARTATVTVKSGELTKTVKVTQAAAEPVVVDAVLEVSVAEVAVAATAGEASFEVTANNAWTATADAAWVSLTPANGEASDKAVAVKVTAEDNTVTEARTATVTVKSGELTKTVKVTQAAAEPVVVEPVLEVSVAEVAVAATAGEASFEVTANNAWTATADAAWVSITPASGEASENAVAVKVTAEDNTATETRTATVTVKSGELTKTVTVTQAAAEPVVLGIKNADDLMAFAAAVNQGGDLSAWTAENGEIKLLADIDLTGKTWVPIGNACIDRTGALQEGSAPAFTGVFDGAGFKVTGLNYTPDGTTMPTCSTFGFFGALSGATVKNLTVEVVKIYAECPNVEFSLGGIAGAACNASTILNCTVLAANAESMIASKQTVTGTTRNNLGGIVGLVGTSTVDGCVNNCPVRVQNTVNTHNGGNAYQVGGIFGYSNGESFALNCTNNAEIGGKVGSEFWGDAPRMGGIVGTANSMITVENCTNNGDVLSTVSGTSDKSSRTAGILSYAGTTDTMIKGCVNNGDVCFIREFANGTDYVACVSGIFGQAGNPVTIENCENYGAILADTWFSCAFSADGSGDNPTMGLIVSRPNTKVVTVKNNKVGGKIGPYSAPDQVVTVDASNYAAYMFGDTAKRRAKIVSEGNTFATK